jgi:hypothetical protein
MTPVGEAAVVVVEWGTSLRLRRRERAARKGRRLRGDDACGEGGDDAGGRGGADACGEAVLTLVERRR